MSAFERGGPVAAAVEATRMPMVVTDATVSGIPIVYANQSLIDLCADSNSGTADAPPL
ncbi:hypothetical protein [Microvirga yunnanensis]|uniref:hypothetical protein n=1 Tax=Microvirga yunnanensis TaxID=2953740 RepID=UPI0021CAB8BA|nr:hypothetical protein [Microvirga sp. HBU67655]